MSQDKSLTRSGEEFFLNKHLSRGILSMMRAFIVVAVVMELLTFGGQPSTAAADGCAPSQTTKVKSSKAPPNASLAKLNPKENSKAWTIDLHRDRGPKTAHFAFETDGQEIDLSSPIRVAILDDLESEDHKRLSLAEPNSGFLPVVDELKPVRLEITGCIDPPDEISADTYKGTIEIYGPTIEPTSINLTVTAQNDSFVWPWVTLLAGGVFGLFLKVGSSMRQSTAPSLTAIKKFAWTPKFIIPVALAFVGLGLVWVKLYASDNTFGGDPGDWTALFLAAGAGFVTGTSVRDFFKR